uniref:NADH dehydrogenase subunit 2 n=1 Tax=Capodemus sinuatus TaxID=2969366 RepID=UPI002176B6AD|nr:NADH dehydrogenase subunit 2 [Capodemus sinuatus]UUJ37725.1 NADH dehydrogenase subunit 2 [Capodemus sinuatus]
MNFSKLLFLIMLFLSTLVSISSNNWIGMWMGMEINIMSFAPLISTYKNMKKSKALMIYFLTQSIGSIIMLFFILLSKFMMLTPNILENSINSMIMISLLIKVGAAPFHNWFPIMMKNLSWKESIILMTWQKVTPLYMLSMIFNNLLIISIILSSLFGAIGGLNYTSTLKIMAFSSINHMGWMMMMMMYNSKWVYYLVIYSVIIMMIIMFFNFHNIFFINQVSSNYNSIMEKLSFSSLMLSMGGLPPFLGFLPKWIAIQAVINFNIPLILFMVMMSILTLFYYMRMISPLILFYSSMNKFFYKKKLMNYTYLIFMINLMFPLFMVLNF